MTTGRPVDAASSEATSRYSSEWRGVGKTYRCCRRPEPGGGGGRRGRLLEPHGRRDRRAGGRSGVRPRRRVQYRDTVLEEMDLRPSSAARRTRPSTSSPIRPARARAREALQDVRTCSTPASTSTDRQRPALEASTTASAADRRPGPQTMPDAVLKTRTRSSSWTSPRGAAGPPARGEDLPGRADRLRLNLLPDREPGRPAGFSDRWRRRSSRSAWSKRPWGSARTGWPIARQLSRRRAAAGVDQAHSQGQRLVRRVPIGAEAGADLDLSG